MERAAALSGTATVIRLPDLPEEIRPNSAHAFGVVPGGLNAANAPGATGTPSVFIPLTVPEGGLCYDDFVARVERELLLQSLNKTGGNKVRAARLLQMKRTTFSEKLKRLQIEDDPADDGEEPQAQAS